MLRTYTAKKGLKQEIKEHGNCTDAQEKHSSQFHPGFDQLAYSPVSL